MLPYMQFAVKQIKHVMAAPQNHFFRLFSGLFWFVLNTFVLKLCHFGQ